MEGMEVFGHDDVPHGHMHIHFDNVRVPKENIRAKAEAWRFPGSTGPWKDTSLCDPLELRKELGTYDTSYHHTDGFGKPIIQLGKNPELVSRARIEIDACRLMVPC